MSLLARIAKARTSEQTQTSSERALFPLETVRNFLETQRLLVVLNMRAQEVHGALLDYHRFVTPHRDEACVSDLSSSDFAPNCPECRKGYLIFDIREGNQLCDRCGVVVHTCLNFLPEVDRVATDSVVNTFDRGIQGVPRWMIRQMASLADRDGDGEAEEGLASFREEVEHWNHYVRLPEDELSFIVDQLGKWKGGGHTRLARVAAALLYRELKEYFPDEQTIRNSVRRRESLPEVTHTVALPQYPCPTCQTCCHDAKSARWHCRSFGKKRRRVV